MREPDFVYGIVPDRGEYGFEVQPSAADRLVVTRVLKLASSFEWTGLVSPDAVAIALDPGSPSLVARYTTDPRDPDGRISLSLQVWIAHDELVIASLVDELWPDQRLSVSKQQYMQSTGRRVCGPENSFAASGFENVSGQQATTRALVSGRPQGSRPNATISSRSRNVSSLALKAFATLMTLLSFGLAGLCFDFHQENDRNNREAVQYAAQRDQAKEDLKKSQDGVAAQTQQHTRAVKSLKLDIESLKAEATSRVAEVSRLMEVINSDTNKVDQVELDALRELRQKVEGNLKTAQDAIDRMKNPLPKKRNLLSDPSGI